MDPRGLRLASCLLVGLAACGQAAPFLGPTGQVVDSIDLARSATIPYRELTREDFQRPSPPPEIRQHPHLGALTCAYIRPSEESTVVALPEREASGRVVYRAVVEQVRFEAYMDPTCSWWNPDNQRLNPEYVLEHEQIHFALFELAARRLSLEATRKARQFDFVAASGEEVAARVNREMEVLLRQALEETLRENERFDRETSLGFEPGHQKRWRDRVEAELAATAR